MLRYLNLRYMKKFGSVIPPEFEDRVDENLLKKIQEYESEKTGFSFILSIFGNVVTVIFIFGGLLNIYNSWISSLNRSFILTGMIFFLLMSYASTFISIPFRNH
jgi:STE24 endopeptidase